MAYNSSAWFVQLGNWKEKLNDFWECLDGVHKTWAFYVDTSLVWTQPLILRYD